MKKHLQHTLLSYVLADNTARWKGLLPRAVPFITLLLVLSGVCYAQAPSVTLAWDLSTSEPLGTGGGYKCYTSKNSMVYGSTPSGSVLPGINTVTLTPLPYGRNYFVCTAFVADGTESDYSNEVSTVIKPKPPTIKSAIQTVLLMPVKTIVKFAGLFKKNQNLRITKVVRA